VPVDPGALNGLDFDHRESHEAIVNGTSARTLSRVCCLLALGAATALAQTAERLEGVVRDASGAVLPGVAVTITDSARTQARTVVTNEHGRYHVDGLKAGRYVVSAVLTGFDPRVTEIVIDNGPATLDLLLAISALSETVTVTATKAGTTEIHSTPIAITALPARTLEQLAVHTIGGLAGFVPALTVSQSPGGHPLVTIRGIGTNSTVPGADPSSTIYLDGVYLGRPAMAALDFLDVERVEILRGPQGTLYGRNSVGGAIHVITRQPTNALETSVRVTAGDYGRLRTEGAVSGPLIKNTVMGRVAFLRGTRDGFVHDLDHPGRSLGSEDTWAGRGQLRVFFGTRSELLLSGDYGRFEGVPLSYAKPIAAKPGFSFDNPTNLRSVRTSHLTSGRNIQRGVSAKLAVQLTATTTLTSLTAYRESNDRLFIDVDATELSVVTGDIPDRQHQVSQEVTVVQRTPKLTWIGGTFIFHDHNEGEIDVTSYPFGTHTRIFPRIGTRAWAIFGQATYRVSSRVSLTGGVRYTDERKGLDNTGGVYRLGTAVLADPGSFYDYVDNANSDAWTPRSSIEVDLSQGTFLYVSATGGFKSGGFNTTARGTGQAFRPEFASTYEGGLKHTMAGGRARANAAVFYNKYRDLQVLSLIAPGQVNINNAGSAGIRGIEVEVSGTPGRSVQLAGNVSWLNASYDRYLARGPGGTTLDAAGNRLSNAPRWSGSASAVYEFATGRRGNAFVRGDVSWQSRVFFTPANDPIETQRAYGLVHLRGGFEPRSRRWEIAVYSRNVTNTEYITGTANVAPNAFTGRPGEPRHWGTQFTIRH
jgi:iron complex outermembrane receptor protein